MSFYIKKLKLSNFLSFFGDHEIDLEPFTAIICNYDEGREDFLKAFEFVFGAKLDDIYVTDTLHLAHPALSQDFEYSTDVECSVEITLEFHEDKHNLRFCRSMKNGELSYKVGDAIVSQNHYENRLRSLNLDTKKKNLIFYNEYFVNTVWGDGDDLEKTVCYCLRENCVVDDWKKARDNVKRLKEAEEDFSRKKYQKLRKNHQMIERFVDDFEKISTERNSLKMKIFEPWLDESSDELSPSLLASNVSALEAGTEEKLQKIGEIIDEQEMLIDEYVDLRKKEKNLLFQLYSDEIKMAQKTGNANIIRERILKLKALARSEEENLAAFWSKIQETDRELDRISQEITKERMSLRQAQNTKNLRVGLTSYGRLMDYLSPSRYFNLLKAILGEEIFYANLTDHRETAVSCMNYIRSNKYEQRETFVVFDEYSSHLKDIIIGSDERGIRLDSLEQLQIFLCKLKQFELIDQVPILIQRNFDFKSGRGNLNENDVIFVRDGIHLKADGLLTRKDDDGDILETEVEMLARLNQLIVNQEIHFGEMHDIYFQRWQTLVNINSLENDIDHLKRKYKVSVRRSPTTCKQMPLGEMYDEYMDVFTEHEKFLEESEKELQETELHEPSQTSSASSSETNLSQVSEEIDICQTSLKEVKDKITATEKSLRELLAASFCISRASYGGTIPTEDLKDKSALYFEREFEKVKELMKKDDIEDFKGNQNWRKETIDNLVDELNDLRALLKTSKNLLKEVSDVRKKKLLSLSEHCNQYLHYTFQHILDNVVPFIDLVFDHSQERLQILTSFREDTVDILDFKHLNTFLKFICILSTFLQISKFEKTPLMVLDNVEEFFPRDSESIKSILDEQTIEKILPEAEDDTRFHLIMRVGEFLSLFIRQNTPGTPVRRNGKSKDQNGPVQIIYFSNRDFHQAADCHVIISAQLLPDEYINEDCDSFSAIKTIHFSD